jgi:K+-transporting ATPase A subunit
VIYKICRIDPAREMSWKTYLLAVLGFSVVGFAYLYTLLRTQAYLPFNPQHFGNVAPDLAWNTAISFLTNTNWQFYSGESTLSYFTQMAGLAWHMFVSAGAGIAIAVAVIRGFVRTDSKTLGNFWVDVTRTILYVLVPISIVSALILLAQGVPQNFSAYIDTKSLEGFAQTITGGPMASMEAIKELGTNGGGFVGANSISPNENPTPFTDIFELFLELLIPAALTYTFGRFARYFAILPAMFVATYPEMNALNVMHLATPQSAILSAVIFNALIIIALIPLALRGVAYKPRGANAVLRENVLVYGLGGIIVPFIGIKAIDLILQALHLTGAAS